MHTPWQRLLGRFETLFIDHAFIRAIHDNKARVTDHLWRSAQPSPAQIRRLAKRGVRTIVNLRGERDCASYLLEKEACQAHSIRLIDLQVRSREPPKQDVIHRLNEVFSQIDYPALIHCKAGSDRVGIAAALFLLLRENASPQAAKEQLSMRYGHVRQSDAGVLGRVIEAYAAHRDRTGEDFLTWVDTVYDPREIKRRHRTSRWARVLYDRVLERE